MMRSSLTYSRFLPFSLAVLSCSNAALFLKETYSICIPICQLNKTHYIPTCISGFSVTLGILKSAHKSISLSNTVQDNSGATSTFTFGSKIVGIDMLRTNSESVPLKNEARLNITLELLPKVN